MVQCTLSHAASSRCQRPHSPSSSFSRQVTAKPQCLTSYTTDHGCSLVTALATACASMLHVSVRFASGLNSAHRHQFTHRAQHTSPWLTTRTFWPSNRSAMSCGRRQHQHRLGGCQPAQEALGSNAHATDLERLRVPGMRLLRFLWEGGEVRRCDADLLCCAQPDASSATSAQHLRCQPHIVATATDLVAPAGPRSRVSVCTTVSPFHIQSFACPTGGFSSWPTSVVGFRTCRHRLPRVPVAHHTGRPHVANHRAA